MSQLSVASGRARTGRSASHTGISTSLLAGCPAGVTVVGLPHGPRLGRSLSQGSNKGFSVHAVGMHYTPSPLVIPARSSSVKRGVSPVLLKPDSRLSLSPPKRRSSLRHLLSVDTKVVLQSHRAEMSMEIAEEVAMLCNANEPLSTDVPLSAAGMSLTHAIQVGRWLQERFDLEKSASELMSDAITPEILASEIIAMSTVASPERPWCTGEIPIMLDGFDLEISPEDMDFDDFVELPSIEMEPRVVSSPEDVNAASVPMANPPILVSPPPAQVEVKPLNIVKERKLARNATASDGKISMKTGIAVGLLAVGALLGSPNRNGFDKLDLALPETPSPFASHFTIPNSSDSVYDHVMDWQNGLTRGAYGIDAEPHLTSWSENRHTSRMM